MRRERDVEAELNLPPGFRFHPTDEELIVQYLCRKVSYQYPPIPIIGEVDIYKYDPWKLPEMALFGTKEWYFFSPRDRKYPNGSRPNRATRNGYWKAAGADKPIRPMGFDKNVGIKKSLVFFSGKAPKGIKTNWIMHEYRLAKPNQPSHKKSSLRLDDWVLCRIYNKKNIWDQKEESSIEETMDSFKVVDDTRSDGNRDLESHTDFYPPRELDEHGVPQSLVGTKTTTMKDEDNDWFMDLNLDDLQDSLTLFGAMPTLDQSYHDSQAPILRI